MNTVMQVVRLDPAFRWTPLMAGVLFLFGLSAGGLEVATSVFALVAPCLLIAALSQANAGRRCEMWQAALPVHGRDLLLARLTACLCMTWTSWLCGVAGLSMRGMSVSNALGGTVGSPLLITMVIAVMLVTRSSAMDPGVSVPVFCAFLSVAAVAIFAGGFFLGPPVLACVALITGGLLAYAIRRAPPAFQVRVQCTRRSETTASAPVGRWRARNAPFLRAVKSWQFLLLCLLSLSLMVYVRGGGQLFVVALLSGFTRPVFDKAAWMYGLPVSRERMLAWAILPWWLLFVASYGAAVVLGPWPPLDKVIAGSNYWLADYMLTQFWLAVSMHCEFWTREAPSLKWGRGWRAIGTLVLFAIPFLLGSRVPFETADGLALQVPVALAIAQYLPSEPAIWVVLICGTPILLWMWLVRAFARTDVQFNQNQAGSLSAN